MVVLLLARCVFASLPKRVITYLVLLKVKKNDIGLLYNSTPEVQVRKSVLFRLLLGVVRQTGPRLTSLPLAVLATLS